jgi:hypothetical protein
VATQPIGLHLYLHLPIIGWLIIVSVSTKEPSPPDNTKCFRNI